MTKKTKHCLALVFRPLLFLLFACVFLWLFPSEGVYYSQTEMRLTTPVRYLTAVLVSETFNGTNLAESGMSVRLVDNDTLRFIYENPSDGIPVRNLLFRYDNFFNLSWRVFVLLALLVFACPFSSRHTTSDKCVCVLVAALSLCIFFFIRCVTLGVVARWCSISTATGIADTTWRGAMPILMYLTMILTCDLPRRLKIRVFLSARTARIVLVAALCCLTGCCRGALSNNSVTITIGGGGDSLYLAVAAFFLGSIINNFVRARRERGSDPQSAEKIAEVVHDKFKPDLAAFHQEHQETRKDFGTAKHSMLGKVNDIIRRNKLWDSLVAKMFREKKIPRQQVVAAVHDRYRCVDWDKIKHRDGVRQIKDVIDYTYNIKPITLGVSKKNLKHLGGITLSEACRQTAILHNVEWAAFTDPYPTPKSLYVACHGLATRKREANPFNIC